MTMLDEQMRILVLALQAGLPAETDPWRIVAGRTGFTQSDVLALVNTMIKTGAIRRIAAVPNHYKLGMTANGMSVWDVSDQAVDRLGAMVGELPFVTHCYRRPRHLPDWPYNLFAMLHGTSRDEVERKRSVVRSLLGDASTRDEILYSTRILKKTGLRISNKGTRKCSA